MDFPLHQVVLHAGWSVLQTHEPFHNVPISPVCLLKIYYRLQIPRRRLGRFLLNLYRSLSLHLIP